MSNTYKLIALALFVSLIGLVGTANAGGPWAEQYCDISTETVITKDENGKILDKVTKEKVICEDGVKDFLHGMEIADSCQIFTWRIPLGEKMVEQRGIACKKMNGGYEIVEGYHSLN
jgi:hypothetical protein